jgi:hypothetical protein
MSSYHNGEECPPERKAAYQAIQREREQWVKNIDAQAAMDDDSIKAMHNLSMKLYDDCAPIRELIKEMPEIKEPIIKALGKVLTQVFAGDFYSGKGPNELPNL